MSTFNIYTHDRIDPTTGLLAKTGLTNGGVLVGGNALQNISITRNMPKNTQQAIGHLGIVDYTSGVVTSDVTLDAIIVEECQKASAATSIMQYAGKTVNMSAEAYAMTSFASTWASATPASANFGFITASLASYLAVKAAPTVEIGEESSYAMVLGDDGSGIQVNCTWTGTTPTISTVPIITATGATGTVSDSGLPAGISNISLNGTVNRDQILDVRSTRPIMFVTTYPVECRMELEVHQIPGTQPTPGVAAAPVWGQLNSLSITATALGKHRTLTPPVVISHANAGDLYIMATGLTQIAEGESAAVGRYLSYTVTYRVADIQMPIAAPV